MKPSGIPAAFTAALLIAVSICAPLTDAPLKTIHLSNTSAVTSKSLSQFEYEIIDDGAYIYSYIGNESIITLPETIDGYPVTSIWGSIISGNTTVTEVIIPAGLTDITDGAFANCDTLIKITVSDDNPSYSSVDGVLYNKSKTELIAFPAGIGGSFTVPDGVTKIMPLAFYRCYRLTSVDMYNSVLGIGKKAFSFCWNLESIRLSDRLQVLDEEALYACDSLLEIHLPATLVNIGKDAVLGTIDSDSHRCYYFINGIYCVKGTYSEKVIKSLGLTPEYESRTITNIDTGVVLTDPGNALPYGTDLIVTPVAESEISEMFTGKKHTGFWAYDISLVKNSVAVTPSKSVTLSFNGLPEGTVFSATKLYRCKSGTAYMFERATTAAAKNASVSVGTELGRFAVLTSNDFSLAGDVDGDGIITLFDARLTLCGAAKTVTLTASQIAAADIFDGNGALTTDDARSVLKKAAGIQ